MFQEFCYFVNVCAKKLLETCGNSCRI